MSKIKLYVWKILRLFNMGPLVLWFHPNSMLNVVGWRQSFRLRKSVDRELKPIPWLTYSFIHFLEPRLKGDFRVFEYGSGNSTLWFADRVQEIISVEHNPVWHNMVCSQLPQNAKTYLKTSEKDYVAEISKHGKFKIVVIDGIIRRRCALASLEALEPDGVIVWDDSNRVEALETRNELQRSGYRVLDFYGISPISFDSKQTSVFYKDGNNCLGI
jgi:hypothetical protein